jgi:hypothetical protein
MLRTAGRGTFDGESRGVKLLREVAAMDEPVMMFLLPLVVVGVGRLGAVVAHRLLPMQPAMAATLAVYYLLIAASVLWVRRAVRGAQHAPSFYSGRRPPAWRVLVAVVLPALPLARSSVQPHHGSPGHWQ